MLTLLISAFVAYGFAAYEFKGRQVLFVIVLIILSIPLEVVMLPLYKQISSWGMMDNYGAIVLPFLLTRQPSSSSGSICWGCRSL